MHDEELVGASRPVTGWEGREGNDARDSRRQAYGLAWPSLTGVRRRLLGCQTEERDPALDGLGSEGDGVANPLERSDVQRSLRREALAIVTRGRERTVLVVLLVLRLPQNRPFGLRFVSVRAGLVHVGPGMLAGMLVVCPVS